MADENDFGFAPPAFNAVDARVKLERSLRDLGLTGRGNGFELRGKPVVQLAVDDGVIAVRIARRLAITPEWDRQLVRNAADQRKLVEEIRRRLERWQRED